MHFVAQQGKVVFNKYAPEQDKSHCFLEYTSLCVVYHSNNSNSAIVITHSRRRVRRGHGDGMINNVGPPAATIEGDVRSLQQCPQLFEVFGEDVHGVLTIPPHSHCYTHTSI